MAAEAGFGVYVHWPFCAAKCPYCDFNSHVTRHVDHTRWRRAFRADIETQAARIGPRRVETVFFGGGTPSLMEPETVAQIIADLDRVWGVAPDAEITLEANPTSVEAGRFRAFRGAGVNRVSMGVQALNDADLKALGRMHSVGEARQAFDIARECFERVSFDLIYARAGQSAAAWRAELGEALAMAVDHFSLYQLTIEPGTRFWDLKARGGLRDLPSEGLGAELYEITQEMTAAAGLPAYEISNHARPGAESRHNLMYWRYGEYAGIGPGAHGRLGPRGARRATETPLQPDAWLTQVETEGHGVSRETLLTAEDERVEAALMGLRLREGVPLARIAPLDTARVDQLVADGFLWRTETELGATPQGRPVLNAVLSELLG